MKNFLIAASAVFIIGGTAIASTAPAEAKTIVKTVVRDYHPHRTICKTTYKTKTVWVHHHRKVSRVKVTRCL